MTPVKLGVQDLARFIQSGGIACEILSLETPTPTVETAARAVNAHPEQIIKSILFLVDEKPILAIACGLSSIDRRPIADLYQVGKKRVRLAAPELVLEISGYEVGAMPPFGHCQPLETLIDPRVLDVTEAYAGGGEENTLLRIDPQEILRVTGARVLSLFAQHIP